DCASGGHIPHAHGLIVSGRCQVPTIRAERHAIELGLVFPQDTKQGALRASRLRIEFPNLHMLIPASSSQTPPRGTAGHVQRGVGALIEQEAVIPAVSPVVTSHHLPRGVYCMGGVGYRAARPKWRTP